MPGSSREDLADYIKYPQSPWQFWRLPSRLHKVPAVYLSVVESTCRTTGSNCSLPVSCGEYLADYRIPNIEIGANLFVGLFRKNTSLLCQVFQLLFSFFVFGFFDKNPVETTYEKIHV